ncbi:Ig-like domain-containing protein [Pseudoalteromonas sp. SS15]|uniref:Ig-like domain-containing protein n=1 Tax=Pseudoalteromonas sp. SS15 TaxID=3139393 RepID=UPI003BAB5407
MNSKAQINTPKSGDIIKGNITVTADQIEDEEGIKKVWLGFSQSDKAFLLCSENCTSPYQLFETGINPYNFNQSPGSIQLQIWVEDLQGNVSIAQNQQFNWLPEKVIMRESIREDDSVTLNWLASSSILRYNAYLSESPIDDLSDFILTDPNQRMISITKNSHVFEKLSARKNYYARVTGIDGSGESAFSENILISAQEVIFPIAVNDEFLIEQFESLSGNLLTNDQDNGLSPIILELTPLIAPEHGELNLFENGDFTYTPQNNFSGIDSFKYRIINPQGLTSEAIVTITIKQINTAPVALFNEFLVSANSEFRVISNALILNDIDFDGGQLSISTIPVNDVEHGTLLLDSSGSFSYTPEQGFIGEDSFTYQLQDGQGGEDTAEVKLTVVEEVNQPTHVSVNDDYLLNEDEVLIIDSPGILGNDIGENLEAYNLSISQTTMNGVLELSASGSFRYFPDENFYGSDYFIYELENAEGVKTSAFVLLNISAVNDAPITQNDDITVSQNQSISIAVLENDYDVDSEIDRASLQIIEQATHGDVTLNLETGTIEYKSATDFRGQDLFSYVVSDTEGLESNPSTVYLDVTGPNKAPIAMNDSAVTQQDTSIEINILDNDTDIDGTIDLNTIKLVTEPQNGTAKFSVELSKLIYIPKDGFYGTDALAYSFQDNEGASSNEATVAITVTRVNKPPIAIDDSFDVDEGTALELNLLQNDSDTDGAINISTIEVIDTAQFGDLEVLSSGNVLYTNTDQSTSIDSFTYRFKDNEGVFSNSATVTINIIEVDTSPITQSDSTETFKNQSISLNVLNNDDFRGIAISESPLIIETQPSHGEVSIVNQTGEINYTPNFNFVGNDTLSYRAINSKGESSLPTSVTILINNKNYTPTIEALVVDITTEFNQGDMIATITASDPDNDDIVYTLSGDSAALFTVNNMGQVTIGDIETIIANGDAQYSVVTKVCDVIDPPLCAESTLTVNVEEILPIEIAVLNSEFANAGIASINLRASLEHHEVGKAITISDGSIFIASGVGHYDEAQGRNIHRAVVTKVTPSGDIDNSFAQEGVFETDLGIQVDGLPQNVVAQNLVFDDVNKFIYVSGYIDQVSSQDIFIMRLTEQGKLDTSFANTGYFIVASDTGKKASSVNLILDSNVLIALINDTTSIDGVDLTEARLIRFDLSSFSVSHSTSLVVDVGSEASGFTLLSENKLMVFGNTNNSSNNSDIYLAKINTTDLSLDSNFQNAGYLQLDLANQNVDNRVKSLIVLPDNQLMLTGDHLTFAGDFSAPSKYSLFLLKMAQDGNLDTTFNELGYRIYAVEDLPTHDSDNDLLTLSAQGVDLKAVSDSLYVTINREIYSSNKAVHLMKVGLDGVIDANWSAPYSGVTAYDIEGIRSHGTLSTTSALVLYGHNHGNIGYNYYASQWLAKVSLTGGLDTEFGYQGQTTLNSSSSDEVVIASAKQSDGDLLLAGHALNWQNERVPYIYSLDFTGNVNQSFGEQGLSRLNFYSDANTRSLSVNEDDSLFLVGNESDSSAFISKLTSSGKPDNFYAHGNDVSYLPSSDFIAESIKPLYIHELPSQEQLLLSDIFDGCITKSVGVYLSSTGSKLSDFTFDPPSEYECTNTAFKLDEIKVTDTGIFGIGADGQSYSTPRIVIVNVDSEGNLVPEFGDAGIAVINVGALLGEELSVNGYSLDSSGSFYIYGQLASTNFIVKVNSLGELETAFATNGIFNYSNYSDDLVAIKKVAFDSQNRLMLFSQSQISNAIYISRLRLDDPPNLLDLQFNESGFQLLDIDTADELIDVQYHNSNDSFLLVLQDTINKRISVAAIQITEQ